MKIFELKNQDDHKFLHKKQQKGTTAVVKEC